MTTYYKVLNLDGTSCHGGTYTWDLPYDGKPGKWTPRIMNPVPCQRGYHILTLDQVPPWLKTVGLWEVEPRGKLLPHDDNKWVCESARLIRRVNQWNPRTIRLLAALWVEHQIPHYFKEYWPQDVPALEKLVEVTRSYAAGLGATLKQVESARRAVRLSSLSSSLSLSSWSLSLSLSSWSLSLSSSSSLSWSSSERQWLRDRWTELLIAPGDWSHVDWTEW